MAPDGLSFAVYRHVARAEWNSVINNLSDGENDDESKRQTAETRLV